MTGDVFVKAARWNGGELQQDTITSGQVVSAIVDPANIPIFWDAVYLTWEGRKWTVTTVTYDRPRMEFTLGTVYNE